MSLPYLTESVFKFADQFIEERQSGIHGIRRTHINAGDFQKGNRIRGRAAGEEFFVIPDSRFAFRKNPVRDGDSGRKAGRERNRLNGESGRGRR